VGVGKKVSKERQGGREPRGVLAAQYRLADRLVFSKLRARFGGRLKYFVSGSAPLAREVEEFFHGAGILVLEGYGLTETSASIFVNLPEAYRFGTVGRAFPGMEAKIADDGEVLVRGPAVMRGYHNLPEETAATLTDDGWLLTGDIGEIDPDGFLKITDRKKDLIKTSGGKYVAPQPIEVLFKALCPYVGQLVVHGERRNFISALISLDEEEIGSWATANGLGALSYGELVVAGETRVLIQGYVDELNGRLARWETIKKFVILPRDLTVEAGELTPSLKVKRKIVEERYRAELDALYTG
jgi:long-chain acyl-CoA synthetase